MTTVRNHGVESNHSKPKKVEDKKDNSQTNKAENPTASKPENKAPETKQAGLVDSVSKLDAAIASTPEPKSNTAVAAASSNPFGTTAAAASTNGKDTSAAMSTSTNPFGTASTTAMSSSDKDSSSSMAVTIGSDGSTNVAMSTSGKDSSSAMGVSTNTNGTSVAMAASDKDSSSSMAVSTGSNGTAAAMSSTYNDTSSSAAVATSGANPFCPPTCETTTSVAAAASSSCETTTSVAAAASSSCETTTSVAAAASSSCNTGSSVAVAAASSGSSNGGSVSVLDEGKGAWGDPHFEIAVDKNKNGKLDSGEKTSFDHKGKSGNTYQIFKTGGMDIKAKYEDTNNPDAPQVMGEVSINDKFKISKDGKLMSMDGKPMTLDQARALGLDIQKTANGYMIKGADGGGDIEIKCNGTYIDVDPKGDFNNASGILGEAMSMFANGNDPASKGNDYWNKYDMGKML